MTALDQRTPDVFATLADTLVAGFDLDEFLDVVATRCAELTGATAAGLLLVDHDGSVNLIGASDRRAWWLHELQVRHCEGPSLDAFLTAEVVRCPDLRHAPWPEFTPAAVASGYGAVHAVPMRLRADVLGGLTLFSAEPGALDEEPIALAQALTKIATIGILQWRAIHHHETVVQQLQTALQSRVVIEQAKGVLAERLQISVAAAFTLLRSHARNTSQRLHDLAAMVVNGSADTSKIAAEPQ